MLTENLGPSLDNFRSVGDSFANEAVQEIFSSGKLETFNSVFEQNIQPEQLESINIPQSLKTYLIESARLPEWIDMEQINIAQNIFSQYGPEILATLLFSSFPSRYAAHKSSYTLYITGGLISEEDTRVTEYCRFVTDILGKKGFDKGGCAIKALQKLRLTNAATRFIAVKKPNWKPEFGYPINQEDMAFDIATLSIVVIAGLRKLSVKLSKKQSDAFIHLWKVAGYMVGITLDLLPSNVDEAKILYTEINKRQFKISEHGIKLMEHYLRFLKIRAPFWAPAQLADGMIRYFQGEENADMLGVGRPRFPVQIFLVIPLKFHALFYMMFRIVPGIKQFNALYSNFRVKRTLKRLGDMKKTLGTMYTALRKDSSNPGFVRKHQRVYVEDLKLTFASAVTDDRAIDVDLVDISEGGLQARTNLDINYEVDDIVDVGVHSSLGNVNVSGVILRLKKDRGEIYIAMKFNPPSDEDKAKLKNIIGT